MRSPAAVVVAACCCLLLQTTPIASQSYKPETWMGDLMAFLGNRTLREISLPGTHDSASYSLTGTFAGISPYMEDLIKLAEDLHLNVTKIVNNWSVTQDLDFYQQFSSGIRYVDLRACYYNGSWRSHHGGVLGNQLSKELDDTARFLSGRSSEVLVMEITHITDQGCDGSDAMAMELVADIHATLGKWLFPTSHAAALHPRTGWPAHSSLDTVTLAEMVAADQRIVVVFNSSMAKSPPGMWPGSTIINTWANSDDLSTMELYNSKQLEFFHSTPIDPSQIFKMSWTLTANYKTVLRSFEPGHPKTLIDLANTASQPLSDWYTSQVIPHVPVYHYPVLGNILIIDHFEASAILERVLEGLLRPQQQQ